MQRLKMLMLLVFCIGMLPFSGLAQQINWQLRNDYRLYVPWEKNLFETEFSYQTILSAEDKWRSFNVSPGYERNISKHLDLLASLVFFFTAQTETSNTFEARNSHKYFLIIVKFKINITFQGEKLGKITF